MSEAQQHRRLLAFAARPIGRLRWRIARILGLWALALALHAWGVPGIVALLVSAAATFGPYLAWLNGRLAEALVCERKHGERERAGWGAK